MKHHERSASLRAHDHGSAQSNTTGLRYVRFEEFFLPCERETHGKAAAEFSGLLVHRTIFGVAIDRSGAGVQPDSRWLLALGDRLTENARRIHARVEDFGAIPGVITTVHTATGEIENCIGSIKFHSPWSERRAVPP